MTYVTELFSRSTSYSDYSSATYRSILLGPKRLLKTQIVERKREPFQWKKSLKNFPALSRTKKHREEYIGVHRVLDAPTQLFEKKGNLFTEKIVWRLFSSFYRVWQSSRDSLHGTTSCYYHCFVYYESIFLGTNRLMKTQIFREEKANFPVKKVTSPIFSVLSSTIKLKELFISVHVVSGKNCGTKNINSVGRKRLLKTQIFEKETQNFQWRKRFGLFFPVLLNMKNVKEFFFKVHKFSDLYCGTYGSIFFGPERLLKTKFLKKNANFLVKKKYFATFSRITECDKSQETIYNGP